MSGPIRDHMRLLITGALFSIGERFRWFVAAVYGLSLILRHGWALLTIAFGLYLLVQSGNVVVAVLATALAYLLVFLGRAALAFRRGSARGAGAILTGMSRGATFSRRWPGTAAVAKLTARTDQGVMTAPLAGPSVILQHGLEVVVAHGEIGKTFADMVTAQDSVKVRADAARCRAIEIPGHSSISKFRIEWGEHLRQTYTLADLDERCQRHPLSAGYIPWGIDEEGEPATCMLDTSILAGGMTGGGKSTWIWSYVFGLLRQGIYPHLWVFDPKGTELAAFGEQAGKGGIVRRYENDVQRMVGDNAHNPGGIWHDIGKALRDREAQVARDGLRKVPYGHEKYRPNIVVVDELLPFREDLAKRATDHAMVRVTYRGRAVLFSAVYATQVAQIDVTGRVRDITPQRVCFATTNGPSTDAILGDHAHSTGARASELDLTRDKGVVYYRQEGRRGFMSARTAMVNDRDTLALAKGELPELSSMVRDKEHRTTYVYRAVAKVPITHDGRTFPVGTIAYVGITQQRPEARWGQHRRDPDEWWAASCDWELVSPSYERLSMARDRESQLIHSWRPLFNHMHNTENEDRIAWRGSAS